MLRQIFEFFVGLFRRSSDRKRTRRNLTDIDVQNEINRNVNQYDSTAIEAFIPYAADNIIVSGENKNLRDRVNCVSAWRCHQEGRGAVVLHCGNHGLSALLDSAFRGESGYYNIDSRNPRYDPFVDLNQAEITQLIFSSSGSSYHIENTGRSFLRGIVNFLNAIGRPACVESVINCLHDRGYEQIDDYVSRRVLDDTLAREISSEIVRGRSEEGNVEYYFETLYNQSQSILAPETARRNAVSIQKALRQREVIVVDVGDASSGLLLNVIVQEIRNAISSGIAFNLIIDSIPVGASESLGQLLRTYAGSWSFVYSSSDVYASMESTASVFDTLHGRANTFIVMRQFANADNLSEALGHYQKIEINRTSTSGDTYYRYGQVLPGSQRSDGITTQYVTRPRVEENDISRQGPDHAYIKRSGNDEIISVNCTNGEARAVYAPPQRMQVRRRRQSTGMSWLVFIVLFIVFMPAAFIYSFVKSGRTGKIISAILFILLIAYVVFYYVYALGSL